jgi:ABC-2 type transport system permease protein
MKSLSIAWKDVQILLKDRGALVQMFLLPLVFVLVFSLAQAGATSAAQPRLVVLPVANLDSGGQAAQQLIGGLNAVGGIQVKLYEEAQAQNMLQKGDIKRLLTIPASFTTDLATGRQTILRLVNHPKADDAESRSVVEVVTGVARDASLKNYIVASLRQMGDMQAASAAGAQVFTAEQTIAQAESQFETSRTRPLIVVEQALPQQITEKGTEINTAVLSVPGFALLFVFLTAQVTARSIYDEKKQGSFRRLLAAPLSKAELLIGKMLPNFAISALQVFVIFAVSIFLLPLLGMERFSIGSDPLAVILLSLVVALCSTALGVVIAALAHTENQIGGVSSLILWVAAAIGGSFFPLFLLGGFWDYIGKIVPHYWALRGYYDLIIRGQGLAGVTTELAALLVFSAAFFIVGLLRFDYD